MIFCDIGKIFEAARCKKLHQIDPSDVVKRSLSGGIRIIVYTTDEEKLITRIKAKSLW